MIGKLIDDVNIHGHVKNYICQLLYVGIIWFLLSLLVDDTTHLILFMALPFRTILKNFGHYSTSCCQIYLIHLRIFLNGSTNPLKVMETILLMK